MGFMVRNTNETNNFNNNKFQHHEKIIPFNSGIGAFVSIKC